MLWQLTVGKLLSLNGTQDGGLVLDDQHVACQPILTAITARSVSLVGTCRAAAAVAEKQTAKQTPHGDKLVNLMLPSDQKQAAIDSASKKLECSDRNACDVELLCVG